MANINLIEDSNGDVIDYEYFCSDSHAKDSEHYNGWYGCVELYSPETCKTCGTMLAYVEDN